MFKTRFKQLDKEGKDILLKRFGKAVREEQINLNYLKEALQSVHKWENNNVYKLFLKDALVKLDRVNDERLNLQYELIENEEIDDEIDI